MKKYFTSPFFTPSITILLWSLFAAIIFVFFSDSIPAVSKTGGLIETITNILYVVMFLSFARFIKDHKGNIKTYLLYIMLALAAFLREMGFQHWLASKDSTAFKSRFFLNPDNPISEKLIAGFIIILIFGAIVYLGIKYSKHLVLSFFKLNATTWSIASLCTVLVTSKFIDRFPSNYKRWTGIKMDLVTKYNLEVFEETGEALLPLIVILILWQYHLIKKQKMQSS